MGRRGRRECRERRERRYQRRIDKMDAGYLAELEERAGITPEIEWGDNDEPVAPPLVQGGDPWKSARLGTVHDVAHVFQVHWKTVEKWRRKDGLPCVRQWGVIRYDLSDVLRWASARKVGE